MRGRLSFAIPECRKIMPLILAGGLASFADTSQAGTTTFTDEASFLASSGLSLFESFEGLADPGTVTSITTANFVIRPQGALSVLGRSWEQS